MATLVLEQDESVRMIETQAVQVNTDVEQGLDQTKKAVKSARAARRKRWICFFILLWCVSIALFLPVVAFADPCAFLRANVQHHHRCAFSPCSLLPEACSDAQALHAVVVVVVVVEVLKNQASPNLPSPSPPLTRATREGALLRSRRCADPSPAALRTPSLTIRANSKSTIAPCRTRAATTTTPLRPRASASPRRSLVRLVGSARLLLALATLARFLSLVQPPSPLYPTDASRFPDPSLRSFAPLARLPPRRSLRLGVLPLAPL